MKTNKAQNRVHGVSANSFVMPIVVILAILHLAIIVVIMMINSSSSRLSTIMRDAGVYTQEATSLLGGSSLLSETSSTYVFMPAIENGETNISPLQAFAAELSQPRRGTDVLNAFQTYDVTGEEMACIEEAANCANAMLDAQLHAISLMSTMYPLPEVPPLTAIPKVELTDQELAMTDEEKITAARNLILDSSYGQSKQSVSQNVNKCVELIQAGSAQASAITGKKLSLLRTTMWVITITIIVILVITFAMLYQQILLPLDHFVRMIPQGISLNEDKGFKEVRLVAAAYNDVKKRRDALDGILRSAAETDALTNLPNRYRFEQFLLESGESGYSMAVVLFDINYLKQTNDTQGHLAGDNLIRTAADCISSCFGENCFRFGGDEFAAIVKDCTPEAIQSMVEHFKEVEQSKDVSISFGFAYTDEIGRTTFKSLMDEADKNMYEQKKAVHLKQDPISWKANPQEA